MSKDPLSGTQIRLELGDQYATIVEVGANVREYTVGDRPVFSPFSAEEVAPASHGAVLVPWPNRIRDGRYVYEGKPLQLPITETERFTALHGLGCWHRWAVQRQSAVAAELTLRLPPTPGYPFDLRFTVRYALTEAGLHVTAQAENLGDSTAPYGVGFHPWLSPGFASLDECTVQLDAATRVVTDIRLLPIGLEPATGRYDLRRNRSLRGLALDDAYVDVLRDADGLSWARLSAPDGRIAAIWMDGSLDAWQVCTGDAVTAPGYRRSGLAAEPMTCVADAFRTGDRLINLQPGQAHEVRWGACLL